MERILANNDEKNGVMIRRKKNAFIRYLKEKRRKEKEGKMGRG